MRQLAGDPVGATIGSSAGRTTDDASSAGNVDSDEPEAFADLWSVGQTCGAGSAGDQRIDDHCCARRDNKRSNEHKNGHPGGNHGRPNQHEDSNLDLGGPPGCD